jgi:hypothetical protein
VSLLQQVAEKAGNLKLKLRIQNLRVRNPDGVPQSSPFSVLSFQFRLSFSAAW